MTIAESRDTQPSGVADRLDAWVDHHMVNVVEQTELYRLLSNPDTPPAFAACLMRHTLVESFSFTPRICTSTMKAIGKMPFEMPEAMKHAFLHVLEEVDHPDMALRTFKALGGDEHWARSRRMTPASFAMCAACDRVVEEVSGVAYLGFMYPFESMTPVLTQRAMQWLGAKGIGSEKREFIDVHAVDDIAHQRSMRNLIGKVVARCPEAAEEIEYSAQVFFSVYPAPIWDAVVLRAKAEIGG
jgi:hypothetical protein